MCRVWKGLRGWDMVYNCMAAWPSPSILIPSRIPVIVIRWLSLPNVSGIAVTFGVCFKKTARISSHHLFVCSAMCTWMQIRMSGVERIQSDMQSSFSLLFRAFPFPLSIFSTSTILKEKNKWGKMQAVVLFSAIVSCPSSLSTSENFSRLLHFSWVC